MEDKNHVNHVMLVVGVIISLQIVGTSGQLKFNARGWPNIKRTGMQNDFDIDCQTNDPQATVLLLYRKNKQYDWKNVESMSNIRNRVTMDGQVFTIATMTRSDAGEFLCKATNAAGEEINLSKGRVMVMHSYGSIKPLIFPKKVKISVERFGVQNITCTTNGKRYLEAKSVLTWWHQQKGGDKRKLADANIAWKKVQRQGKANFEAVLALSNFKEVDVGFYYCHRKVGTASTDHMIELQLKPDKTPEVKLDPPGSSNMLKPAVFSNLTITCTSQGSPTPTAVWRKDGNVIRDCGKVASCSIQLERIEYKRDGGRYTCSAYNFVKNNVLKNVSQSTIVEVQVPPKVKKLLPKEFLFKRGEEVEISLIVSESNPPATARWQWKRPCPPGKICAAEHKSWQDILQQFPERTKQTSVSYMLTQKNDEDRTYRYIVKNSSGNETEEFQILRTGTNVQFEMKATGETVRIIKQKPLKIEVVEEKSFKVSCRTDSDIFQKVRLRFKSNTLPTSEPKVEGNMRILEYELQSMNIDNIGYYTCEALSKIQDSLPDAEYRKRRVYVSMKALYAPKITSFEDKTVNQDDEHIMIKCGVDGLPYPNVSWMFNNVSLSMNKMKTFSKCDVYQSGVYQLEDPQNAFAICTMKFNEHQGSYTCIATNKKGSVSKEMMLTILAKPEPPKLPPSVTVSYGVEQVVNCSTLSNPRSNVSWYRMNPEDNQTTYISSKLSTNKLVLKWHPKNTAGLYICNASNDLGAAEGEPVEVLVTERVFTPQKETWKVIVGVLVTAAVLLLISFIFCWLWMRYFKKTYAKFLEPNKNFQFDPDRSLFEQSIDLPYDVAWEFPRKRINFMKLLGSGEFGQVWLANAKGIRWFKPRDKSNDAVRRRRLIQSANFCCNCTCGLEDDSDGMKSTVAVKTLKSDATESDYKDLASELKILIHLGEHPNIVNVLGACTKEGKLHCLLEYCPNGNLLDFLRKRRTMFENKWKKEDRDMAREFTLVDLMVIVYQVAKGMDFLQSKKCVHRDLAGRNILVGDNYMMKIADFGLARDIYKEDVYLKKTTGLLPIKWMAPEALFDKMHTSMSDVWSYGILLWEVFTLGGSPYPSIPSEDLFSYLKTGKRMDRPEHCPPPVYTVMLDCWQNAPSRRPMFSDIKQKLKDIQGRHFPSNNAYVNVNFGNNDNNNNNENRSSMLNGLNTTLQDDMYGADPSRALTNNSHPLATFRGEAESSSSSGKEPLLYRNVPPTTPTSNAYVTMTASDHYKTPSTSAHEYVPYTDDKDGGTYV